MSRQGLSKELTPALRGGMNVKTVWLKIGYPRAMLLAVLSVMFYPAASSAGPITLPEATLDAIFSQASFNGKTIDIRFNRWLSIHDSTLATIDNEAEWNRLVSLAPAKIPPVNLVFVDAINWCGMVEPAAGCGQQPGNISVVDVDLIMGATGAEIIAHELGHNLGLPHLATMPNLMHPTEYGTTTLTADQVAAVLASNLIQTDASGNLFIAITPMVIPEPGSLLVLLLGMLVLYGKVRIVPH